MKIQKKIFLLFGGLIFLSIALILIGVSFQLEQSLKRILIDDLRGVNKTLVEYEKARLELLRTKTAILAEEPRLKAALDTGDPATIYQEASKFVSMVDADIMLLTDARGVIMAHIGDSLKTPLINWDMLRKALLYEPADGIAIIGATYYHIVSSPVTILASNGEAVLLGTISIGIKIDQSFLQNLESITDCTVAFRGKPPGQAGTVPVFADISRTLSQPDQQRLLKALAEPAKVHEMDIMGEKQLLLISPYLEGTDSYFLLMKSLDKALTPILRPTLQFLLLVGIVALLITLLISYFISRGISNPITSLLDAIGWVGKGDLERPIESNGTDEIGRLGTAFEKMRVSLKENIANLEKTYARLVLSEKLATTGKLLAHLSHELNNPIHNISSALETTLAKSTEHTTRNIVEIAYEEIKRLQKLVHQTLNFYRPGEREKSWVDLNGMISDILSLSARTFAKRGITVRYRLQTVLPRVLCNGDQIKQVLVNLILNAQDAMSDGGELVVSSFSNKSWVTVEVQDTGPGVVPPYQNRIFDAFFTTKTQVSGVGLGLSVSYEIIQQHGGEIYLDNRYPNGARFVVKLPLKQEHKNETE